jgi:CubicO group peptidase (beta-lactamase class C family)
MMERGGALVGAHLFGPDTVKEVTALQVEGTDASLDQFSQRSLGFALADERMGASEGDATKTFGHGGAGTSVGWADSESGLAVGYITNGFRSRDPNNARIAAISQAIRDACN